MQNAAGMPQRQFRCNRFWALSWLFFSLSHWTSGLEECQQVGIELLLVSLGQAMGCACIDLKSRVFDEFGRGKSRGADRYDLVVVAVNDQRWDVEFLEVFGEVRLGECLDAVKRVLMARLHALEPEPVDHALRDLRARPVEAEERPACEVLVELRSAGDGAGADFVEDLHWQAAGIGRRLQHQRRDCGGQRRFGQTFRAVATDIAGDFATTRGEADQSREFEVERFHESREVISVGFHVVASPGLAGAAMATTVMGDRAIAVGCQEDHLGLPAIGIQWPAVAEHDGLSCAPILVEISVPSLVVIELVALPPFFCSCVVALIARWTPNQEPRQRRDTRIPDATGGPARPTPPPGSTSIFMGATNS